MPGPALHDIIVEKIMNEILHTDKFNHLFTEDEKKKILNLLSDPKNIPYLKLGCQGPDFFFFNTKDMQSHIGELVEIYFKVADFINEFIEEIKAIFPDEFWEALEAIEEATEEVVESSSFLSELEQTFSDMNLVLTGLFETLVEKVKEFISDYDLFDLFGHPYRDGVPKGDNWWWFDALHYRHTGKFAQALLEKTKDLNDPLHLYALGYLTHVAGDTVGHPYVNLVSGGPYRSHGQRHKTGENYQDVFNFDKYGFGDFNRSRLHAFYNFDFDGTIDTDNEIPDPNTQMPVELSELIAETINEIYNLNSIPGAEYGSQIDSGDVNNTYRLWYRWFKNTTDTGTLPEPKPYSFTEELLEVYEKAKDNLDDIGDFLEDAANTAANIGGLLGLLLFLAALVLAAIAAAAAIADAIAGALLTIGTSTIRAGAALIYEHVYNAYQSFRLAVATNGLAFPLPEHLSDPILSQFETPSSPDPTPAGIIAANIYNKLPLLRWNDQPMPGSGGKTLEELFESTTGLEDHLIYPITDPEQNNSTGAPWSYLDKDSMFYVNGNIPFTNGILPKLVEFANAGGEEKDFKRLFFGRKVALGNALTLTKNLYNEWKQGRRIPDFNLDADRGYGYLCWTQLDDSGNENDIAFPDKLDVNNSDDPVNLKFLKND